MAFMANEQPKTTTAANDPDCNVYIANLPHDFGKNRLHSLFAQYGEIIRHKFVAPQSVSEPGYGFVQFAERKDAHTAIKNLQNYKFATGETIYISLALHRRSSLSDEPTNLYVKNVPSQWNNQTLYKTFSKYGSIRQSKIIKEGIAFVRYDDHNSALNAIDGLNGIQGLNITFATRKSAATSYQQQQIPSTHKANEHNLYVRNLPSFFTQKDLENLFKAFGKICAAKLNSKGIAFVRFVSAKDALNAVNKLHRTKPNGFTQEIVVKLAHFDIGDPRNRNNAKKAIKNTVPSLTANMTGLSNGLLPSVNLLNMPNMANMAQWNTQNVPNLATMPNLYGLQSQNMANLSTMPNLVFPVGQQQMGYIIPTQILPMPSVGNVPMNGMPNLGNNNNINMRMPNVSNVYPNNVHTTKMPNVNVQNMSHIPNLLNLPHVPNVSNGSNVSGSNDTNGASQLQ